MNIPRFLKIVDGLYRGGKPSPYDVVTLKNKYGINKIVSLDKRCGNDIKNVCKDLNIEHKIIDIDGSKKSLLNLFNHNLKDLLLSNGPVFFHCYHGKDRTGMLAAVFKCKFMGMSPKDALKEARELGFGEGVDPKWVKLFEDIINSCKSNTDENFATIVNNQREYSGDNREYLDEANRQSFAPYLPAPRQYPFHSVYPDNVEQDGTREKNNDSIKQHKYKGFPLSGLRETTQEMSGAGFIFAEKNFNMEKRSYILDMSYDITDLEKQKADQAIMCFDQTIKDMYKASEYLSLIKDPFEKDANIDPKDIMNIRAQLRDYRDNALNKFNNFKSSAIKCLKIMNSFSSDTQTVKLMKVFVSSIEQIEETVNDFMGLFSSLDSDDFPSKIVNKASKIQTDCDILEDIVYNRIIKHIKSNILASSWVDSVDLNNDNKQEDVPVMLKHYNKYNKSE